MGLRVVWCQDLNFWVYPGGAEQTDRQLVIAGIRRGHEIELITPERFSSAETVKCDLVVFSNIHVLMQTTPKQLLKLAERGPYVMWHHDYFCRYRLYYPMLEKCKQCSYLDPWRKLYNNSLLNIFMSPLHRKAFLFAMPELQAHPYALVPSAIDTKKYEHEPVDPKPNTVIGVNSLFGFKGSTSVLEYAKLHPELAFTFVGGNEVNTLPLNCQYLGFKEGKELVDLYASHESFIHLPTCIMPCDRTPAEFIIANPKGRLIVNNNIGILSYSNIIKDGKINREELIRLVSSSAETFWKAVEEHLGGLVKHD